MSKVCITGGAGFIGSHLTEMFLRQGHDLFVIDDLSTGARENVPAGVQLHQLDICSKEAAELIRELQPELIVHAAAQMSVRLSMENPLHDTRVNVLGVANLLHVATAFSPSPRFIFLSTGGAIYGEQETFPARETHPIAPTSLYGLNKFVGERYLDFWHRSYGLSYAALRLGNVYGPRQNPHGEAGVVAIFFQKLLSGIQPTIYGDGEQTRDFIYVGDVVEAVRLASLSDEQGSFNVGSGRETSVNKLLEAICGVLQVPSSPDYAPARVGEQQRSSIDPTRISEKLGWRAASTLEQGFLKTASWFRDGSERGAGNQ